MVTLSINAAKLPGLLSAISERARSGDLARVAASRYLELLRRHFRSALAYGKRLADLRRALNKPIFRPKGTRILAFREDDGSFQPLGGAGRSTPAEACVAGPSAMEGHLGPPGTAAVRTGNRRKTRAGGPHLAAHRRTLRAVRRPSRE
ncbi:MAG: hypothetical protein ACI4RT_06625 [Candidatus Spyradenecus sp.]